MKRHGFIIIIAILLAGAGCRPNDLAANKATALPAAIKWTNAGKNTARYECDPPACAAKMVVYRFPKDGFSWRFENSAAPLTVQGHLMADPKAVFAINGVYFDEKNLPTGLFITNDAVVGTKQYEMGKSAVLELAPEIKIINTAKDEFNGKNISEAAQSYPLLIADGVVQKVAAEKAARRSFAGLDKQGNVYFGIIPDDEVSLASAASLIAKTGVAWTDVLNLDGGPSSGLAANLPGANETVNSIVQVPNAIIADPK